MFAFISNRDLYEFVKKINDLIWRRAGTREAYRREAYRIGMLMYEWVLDDLIFRISLTDEDKNTILSKAMAQEYLVRLVISHLIHRKPEEDWEIREIVNSIDSLLKYNKYDKYITLEDLKWLYEHALE